MTNTTSEYTQEIIGRFEEDGCIEEDHYSKIVDFLFKNKGVMTPEDLSNIICDPEIFSQVTGDTSWLDVEDSYDSYEKLYPVFKFKTKNGRPLTSPFGFLTHMCKTLGLSTPDEYDRSDLDDYIDCDYVTYTYTQSGWTWVEVGHTDPEWTVLHYTFGEGHGLYDYIDGTEEEY